MFQSAPPSFPSEVCSTWRSGPKEGFCWQCEKAICCYLNRSLKKKKHTAEEKKGTVRVCVQSAGERLTHGPEARSRSAFLCKRNNQVFYNYYLLRKSSPSWIKPGFLCWDLVKVIFSASCCFHFFRASCTLKTLEKQLSQLMICRCRGKCAQTLLTLIAADHKANVAVSPRLTLMERTGFHLKSKVSFFPSLSALFVCCAGDTRPRESEDL